MKNPKQTLSENSFILLFSTAIVKIIGALFKIPLATDTFLGDVGFGYFSVAHDIFMPFYILAISGLPSSVSHITAEYIANKNFTAVNKNFKTTKRLFFILGIVFSLGVTALSVPLVFGSQTEQNTFLSIIAIVPSIFFCFIISLYRGYFEGFNNMYPTAISKLIEAVFKLTCGLLFSYFVIKHTNNPALASAAAISAISLGTVISTIYLSLKSKNKNPIKNLSVGITDDNKSFISAKALLIAAIPYVVASLSSSVIALVDVLTIKNYIANADTQYLKVVSDNISVASTELSTFLYGVRSKAFTLYYLIPTITMSLGISALPLLTEFNLKKDRSALKKSADFTLKLISVVTFPASIGLIVLSKQIMSLVFSSSDALGGNLLMLYGLCAIFAGFAVPLTTVVQAFGLQNKVLKSISVGLIIKVVSGIILVTQPQIHIYSAPLGTLMCYVYMSIYLFIVLYKKVENLNIKNSLVKPLVSALICGLTAFLITQAGENSLTTLVAIIGAVLVYFSLIFFSKTFTKEEISNFPIINKILK